MIKYVFLTLFIGIISFCVQAQTDPNDINDIIFWYSGDSVTYDSNQKVSVLHDKSGNGFNAVQSQITNQPLLVNDHNQPTLLFNGVNNYLDCDFNQSFGSPNTFFILLKDVSTSGNKYYYSSLSYPGGYSFYHRANLTMSIHSGSSFTQSYPKTFPFGYTLFTIQYNNGSFVIRENGVQKDNGSTGTGVLDGIRVGARFDIDYFFSGNISELIAYNRSLDSTEINFIENYLMTNFSPPVNLGPNISQYGFCDTTLYAGEHFTSYLWSDGSTADSLIANGPGTYWVEVEDVFGNISSDTIEVLSGLNYPTSQFYCPSGFIDWQTGLGEHYAYLWSDSSTADSLVINSPGSYHVMVTDTNGCVFQSDTLTFAEDPFSTTATLGSDKDLCSGNKLSLITGANEATDYVWNTGETTSEIEITTSGTYSVAVQNANGCSVKDTIAITIIGDAPNILADVPAYVCTAAPFAYEDLSSTTDGSSIVSSDWNFGNGETASATQGSFAYSADGNYDITLTIATSSGCFNTTTVPIEVKANPSLSFTSTNSCQRQEIVFNGGQFSPQTITNWSWNFGDPASGTANTANGQNVEHTFYVSGDYDIMLIGTDIFGCVDTLLQNKTIDPAPVVSFIFEEVCEGNVVSFQNASTIVAPAEIATYQWDFGDGTNSGQMHPQKPYASQGSYAVELTAIANNNCHTSAEKTIKIHAFPQIGFDIEQDCAGVSTQFSDASYIPNGSVAKVEWAFDSESPTTGFVLNRTFENSGIYTLNQTVTSGFGCLSSKTSAVAIKDFLQAGFDFSPAAFVTDYPIVFESTSTGANEYHWSFGDFATAQQADTVIIFEENQIGNVYEVKLRVENSHGCIDSVSIQKTVLERETDLELIQLFVQEANHFLTLGVRLKNNGSTPITAVDLIINSPSTGLIKETWSGLLQAGEEENYIFSVALSAKVSAEDANRNFLCIKGNIVQPAQFTEIDMLNNEICKAMTENQMVIVQPYPNPVEEELIVKVVMPQKQVIDLYVYDSHGKRVHTITEKQELKEGLNAFVVETSTWGSGSYRIVYGKESIGIVKL